VVLKASNSWPMTFLSSCMRDSSLADDLRRPLSSPLPLVAPVKALRGEEYDSEKVFDYS
jgi:hypothetical protein